MNWFHLSPLVWFSTIHLNRFSILSSPLLSSSLSCPLIHSFIFPQTLLYYITLHYDVLYYIILLYSFFLFNFIYFCFHVINFSGWRRYCQCSVGSCKYKEMPKMHHSHWERWRMQSYELPKVQVCKTGYHMIWLAFNSIECVLWVL